MATPSRALSLRAALAPYVERGALPGYVAAVVRDGREELEVQGVTSAGGSEPLAADTIFRVSSLTKPVTATAAMLLVEEGRLHLDEPIDRLLPELAGRRVLRHVEGPIDDVVPAVRALTVRDLLTFRLGFGLLLVPPGTYPIQTALDALALGEGIPRPAEPPELDTWLHRFATLPLMHQPGERWLYNTSANVLGALVARAAERPFDVFLRERLFEPLGMHDTDFSVPAHKLARFTPSYLVDPRTQKPTLYDPVDGQWSRPPAFPSGGAGLVSTVPDFLRFAALLAARGVVNGRRLLSEESVHALTTDALTPENKAFGGLVPGFFASYGWGFGMAVVTAERDELGRSAGTYGWDGGLGSTWYNDPATRTTGVLFTQCAWSNPSPPPAFRDFWRALTASA
ncbi:MAG TPA: serine hydrolase domain-containing protein [Polyangiaceae bacterium]|nr:serine hydrolase domain-containing protein [Polyangiaceae bacterium]